MFVRYICLIIIRLDRSRTLPSLFYVYVLFRGKRGAVCGNGSHLCTPVLMNMSNITFVFNKCSEKNNIHDYIFG